MKLETILADIKKHNDDLYKSYSPTEKIDFSKCKKNWGTDVIPKEFWIDTTKEYKTKSGLKVTNLELVLENSNDKEVTYPIKGTILTKKGNKTTSEYAIWSLDGRADIVTNDKERFDLVQVEA